MNTTSKVLSDLFQEETNYVRHAALTEILQACKARLVEFFPTGIPREAIERFVEEGSLLYADILGHYGVRAGQITAEQVDLIEELFWYAKYAYLRTQAKPHYLQWEEVIALVKELRRENPTAAELRRDYMDHLDMIGGERRYFASPEDMRDCRCWEYVEPTPPANQAQAMYAVCDSINAMVLGLLRYKLYADVHINEVMDFDAILADIERMQAGDLAGIDQESWSVEYTIRKAIYLIENGGTEDELARARSQLDELDAADWPAAVELKAMSFAQGNCLYARDDKMSLEYYLRFKNLIWAVADIDDRTRVASYIGSLYYDGGKNLRPDYEEAYRYLCYALTGKFLRPSGAVAEALLSGDEEAKRRAIGVMREKV